MAVAIPEYGAGFVTLCAPRSGERVFVSLFVAPLVWSRPLQELRDFPWRCRCQDVARGFVVATTPSPAQCEDVVCSRDFFPPSAQSFAHVGSQGVIPLEGRTGVVPVSEAY